MDMKRKLVVDGLLKVENSGFSNLVFSAIMDNSTLTVQDKSFAAKVFYGTIERKLTLNYILQKFIKKPLAKMDKEILAILQSGLYQMLYMDSVPSHGAINQAVSLCPVFKKTSAKGLVNAVLRSCEGFDISAEVFVNEIDALEILHSINSDIIRVIKRDYPTEYIDILKGMHILPKLTIRVNTIKNSPAQLKELFDKSHIKYTDTPVLDVLELFYRGNVTKIPGFSDGLFFIQGATSQYAVAAANIKKGDMVADICAAPGGKSFSAAIILENTGTVFACDINESRLPLIDDGARRLGITNIKTIQASGEVYNDMLCNMDVVLCDVPCSGIGIIPKKPDLRYKSLKDIEKLSKLQYDILKNSASYVKLNGKIVYSTCTINKQENEQVVDKFLKEHSGFRLVKQHCPVDNVINDNEKITFLSHYSGFDGFFVAVLEKLW